MISDDVIAALKSRLGPKGWKAGSDAESYLREQRGRYTGETPLVCLPDSAEAVRDIVVICRAARLPVVPQGGNTGLVCGALPRGEILLSLARLNRIRNIDAENFSITAEAGVTLSAIQNAAAAAGRLFPLSLASEGTATAGGAISTNAGGVQVLKFGTMRDLVLGIEAVLPNGSLWNGLTRLRKDNTGYALKHLFIGAEGTLGIVTAASLKLFPAPRERAAAWAPVESPAAALSLLARLREETDDNVTSFELICRAGLELALSHIPGTRDPSGAPAPWYVLAETFTSAERLANALTAANAGDAVLAQTETQRSDFWRLRESLPEAQKRAGASIKHDIAVPVSLVPAFLDAATAAAAAMVPGVRPIPFGHLGDGSIHFNLTQPDGMDPAAFLARGPELNARIHEIALSFGGSISAEHGIGRLKREELRRMKEPAELAMMRVIKSALDPENLMNPGAILESQED